MYLTGYSDVRWDKIQQRLAGRFSLLGSTEHENKKTLTVGVYKYDYEKISNFDIRYIASFYTPDKFLLDSATLNKEAMADNKNHYACVIDITVEPLKKLTYAAYNDLIEEERKSFRKTPPTEEKTNETLLKIKEIYSKTTDKESVESLYKVLTGKDLQAAIVKEASSEEIELDN